jgi:hypothetical protein
VRRLRASSFKKPEDAPAGVRVLRVEVNIEGTGPEGPFWAAMWVFDGPIIYDGMGQAGQLDIAGAEGASYWEQSLPDMLFVEYNGSFAVGAAWSIAAQPDGVTPALLIPQSGLVTGIT